METIVAQEKEIKLLKVDLAKQYKLNAKLLEALKAIRENTQKEI
jgi:uncharacterized membrane protein